jgi:hypothetical protein
MRLFKRGISVKYLVLLLLIMMSRFLSAEPVITEDLLRSISKEIIQSVKDQDISVVKKYIYPGTKLIIDMDPSPSAGKSEIPYDKYIALTEMGFSAMQEAEIHDEIVSIEIDKENNQGTIEEKITATLKMFGIKMRDVSISTTVYGIIDGQVKALHAEDELISSGPIM